MQMLEGTYSAKPFTTYWYYPDASKHECTFCASETSHYLMIYKIYLGVQTPIFSTNTNHYFVCSNCGHHISIDSKDDIKMHLLKIRGKKPKKYDKYSQLNLEGYEEDELLLFGTNKELKRNIEMHWIDMKRNQQDSQR